MPNIIKDIAGKRYGRLVVKSIDGRMEKQCAWMCQCDCGNAVRVRGSFLRCGMTRSCGCLQKELVGNRVTDHGHAKRGRRSKTWNAWSAMWGRCANPKNKHFRDYGGRGISVCSEWKMFESFLRDIGEAPAGLSLDRIDNEKWYCKENCRWATAKQQANNRRTPQRKREL